MTPAATADLLIAAKAIATLLILPCAIWGALALWYRISDSRGIGALAATLWAFLGAVALSALWNGHYAPACAVVAAAAAGLLAWWARLRPSQMGEWSDDVAEMTSGEVDGSRIVLHNVRNFDWRTTSDYTPRWETRRYDLERLDSVDIVMSYWRGPAIAHMLVSFGFGDGAQVAFSVEIRRRRNQQFSEIGGFFKEFELSIIAADEFDVVRLRSNIRGERVYLYRLVLPPAARRALLLAYVDEANRLVAAPRFYNTITVNCTTLVYQMMRRILGHLPLSYRLLFSGYIPEYMYGVGRLDRRFTLDELRSRGYLSDRARQSDRIEGFSSDIREGIPLSPDTPVHIAPVRQRPSTSATG